VEAAHERVRHSNCQALLFVAAVGVVEEADETVFWFKLPDCVAGSNEWFD